MSPAPRRVACWALHRVGEPLVREDRPLPPPGDGEAIVEVAGCGVCHTDVGYAIEGVRARHPLPLTLGHEIAGVVVAAGRAHAALVGRKVVVPAVIPCGRCALCRDGHGTICRSQVFPGCDVHGGFASHVVVPAHGLCVVDDAALNDSGLQLADLAVLGDAVSTAWQAVRRAEVAAGDVVVVVGAGGVGGFAAQIAAALEARVVALDVDPGRLAALSPWGPEWSLNVQGREPREIRAAVRAHAEANDWPDARWRILECSGTAAGQAIAFGLLNFGATLGIVGYTLDPVQLRLSNLMAFDARAVGTWGCPPEHLPAALDLVLTGRVVLGPFVEHRPMRTINEVLLDLHARRLRRRPILIPDFE